MRKTTTNGQMNSLQSQPTDEFDEAQTSKIHKVVDEIDKEQRGKDYKARNKLDHAQTSKARKSMGKLDEVQTSKVRETTDERDRAQISKTRKSTSELEHAQIDKVRKPKDKLDRTHLFSTRQHQKMLHLTEFVRQQALFALICGNTGTGKTAAARHIYATSKHTFYTKVEDGLSWRELLQKVAKSLMSSHILESSNDLPYRTDALRSKLQQQVARLASSRPLLIIDEAEELADRVARKLKRLHTLTEGQIGVLIVAHPELRRRLAKASGLHSDGQPRSGHPETQYATLWRRLTHFDLPSVSEEDIKQLCQNELHIKDPAVVALAQKRWSNYGYMARDLLVAEKAGLAWKTMTADEFQFITKT